MFMPSTTFKKSSSHLIALACVLLGASTVFTAPMTPLSRAQQVVVENPEDDMSSRPWQVAIPDPAVQLPRQNQHGGQQSAMYGQGRGVMPQPAHPGSYGGMYYGQPQQQQQQYPPPQHLDKQYAQFPGQMGPTHFAPINPYAASTQAFHQPYAQYPQYPGQMGPTQFFAPINPYASVSTEPPLNSAAIVGTGRTYVVNPRGAQGPIPVDPSQQQRFQQLHKQMGKSGQVGF